MVFLPTFPPLLIDQLFSIWDPNLYSTAGESITPEERYLTAERAVFSFLLQQAGGYTESQCLMLLKSTPLLRNMYQKFIGSSKNEDLIAPLFLPAVQATRSVLEKSGMKKLPYTFLGSFFERFGIFNHGNTSATARNDMGAFFTPGEIAEFIVNTTLDLGCFTETNDNLKCLDPASGGGIFLVALAAVLYSKTFRNVPPNSDVRADNIRSLLTRQIWSIDILPGAQRVSQLQLVLWALTNVPEIDLREVSSWVKNCSQGDFLSDSPRMNTNYSLIVGNPPFGNLLSPEQKRGIKSWAKTRTGEISELFLDRALQILSPDGCLGFVMPKTMAYYAQWARARALLFPSRIAGVADLGLSFPGVNFETMAIFARNNCSTQLGSEFPIYDLHQGKIGAFPRPLVLETGIIPLHPLNPSEETFTNAIRASSAPISKYVQPQEVMRGIYLPERIKTECRSGELLWINRVPDIQHYAIKHIWKIDPGVIIHENPDRLNALQVPKILLKVLRGRKVSAIADPWGIFVPTEKVVSILLRNSTPRAILALTACLNSWVGSYYLQKLIFSDTTESARVLDFPYLQYIPILHQNDKITEILSDLCLLLMLGAQIQVQVPSLSSPQILNRLGNGFQQILFLSYLGKNPPSREFILNADFPRYLDLLRKLYLQRACSVPEGGLSRVALNNLSQTENLGHFEGPEIRDQVQSVINCATKLASSSDFQEIQRQAEKYPAWSRLVQYFNNKT